MISTIKILSTKQLSWDQKSSLMHKNISLIEASMIKIDFLDFEIIQPFDALVITSINAVKSLIKNKITLKEHQSVWCIGKKTRDFLEQNQLNVEVCFDYAKELNTYIKHNNNHCFLWLRGNLSTDDLTKDFDNRINWTEMITYNTTLSPQEIEDKIDAIMFFSPSGVQSYLMNNKINHQICFCIGNTTANELIKLNIPNIIIAKQTSVESVIESIQQYYKIQ